MSSSSSSPIHDASPAVASAIITADDSQRANNLELIEIVTDEMDLKQASGFRFSNEFLDKDVEILKDQVRKMGGQPLRYIPLEKIQKELSDIFEEVNAGKEFDEERLNFLLACLDSNPEYKLQLQREKDMWQQETAAFVSQSLATMRSFIPATIFTCSKGTLVEFYGYSNALASRIFSKKCLWLIVMPPMDIHRIHVADLLNNFNHQSQNLDIVEYAALHAAVPAVLNYDGRSGKKARWRISLEEALKELYKKMRTGNLVESKKRNPVYRNQLGRCEIIEQQSLEV